jgi:hypothetical protein
MIEYWATNPEVKRPVVPEGYIYWDFRTPPFPDLADLSPAEKNLLRPVIAGNPEILRHEIIVCGEGVGTAAIQ